MFVILRSPATLEFMHCSLALWHPSTIIMNLSIVQMHLAAHAELEWHAWERWRGWQRELEGEKKHREKEQKRHLNMFEFGFLTMWRVFHFIMKCICYAKFWQVHDQFQWCSQTKFLCVSCVYYKTLK